ncbi:MAG: methyltransferase domain-containing protein [Chitinophagales bacterium]|nr:methyltransferase domain-containing protein [Chitinophagales bacterium]
MSVDIDTNLTETLQKILHYYDVCWLGRFKDGHNPISLAMHMGHFEGDNKDNDLAKMKANQSLARFINIPSNEERSIADFGCGIGGTCFYLANTYTSAAITGINISASQVAYANQLLKQRPNTNNLQFLRADYAQTSLPDSSFDYVIAIESICHAPNKTKVFQEAYRILKPNGVFAFMDYFEEEATNYMQAHWLAEFREGWAVEQYLKNSQSELENVGFKDVVEEDITSLIYQGIEYSAIKATVALSKGNQENVVEKHLSACIALKNLVDNKLISYKMVKALKL